MDVSLFGAATHALGILADPLRMTMLAGGVLMGLFLGIIPGVGGLTGMALLLPFTFSMDPYAAFAMLLGMSAVTGTSDTIPAVLFGVPGTSAAQATVLDGNAMAKNGEAGRALSAAFSASLLGGLVGATLLALTIPLLRPIMLYIGSPELLAISVVGIAMVAVLSGSAPLRGLTAAGIGILLSMIGADSQTGTLRYTMDTFYLWDGLPIVPLALGLYALPELADLAISRGSIAASATHDVRKGMAMGFRDTIRNWWLVLRGGAVGAGVGAIPGLGASVVDWIAYGWALKSVKGADKTFGKGDVRGVLAPESANNALTAGALVPTIAFGVPGSPSMAILLSVFLVHGLVPGPGMLSTNLDFTYAMVWSVAMANILGAGLCFAFSGQLAKVALLRYTLILPVVVIFVFVGSFQASRNWGDLIALLLFGVIGWIMKQMRWPRPPLVLGFVLGGLIERYLFISTGRYGTEWLLRPAVLLLFAAAAFILLQPFWTHIKSLGGPGGIRRHIGPPRLHARDLFYIAVIALVGYAVWQAAAWPWGAKVGPMTVGVATLIFSVAGLFYQLFSRSVLAGRAEAGEVQQGVHMDTVSDHSAIGMKAMLTRAAIFLGYMLLFLALMAVIGVIPAVPALVIAYMRIEGKERWRLVLAEAAVLTLVVYGVFDQLLLIPWPPTLIGQWFPVLTAIPSV